MLLRSVSLVIVSAAMVVGVAWADDPKAALAEKGIKIVSTGVQLDEESEFALKLRDSAKLSKAIRDANGKLAQVERAAGERQRMIGLMTQERVNLQAQYNQTNNIALQNRIVVRINELGDRIRLMLDDESLNKQLRDARTAANQAREDYIEFILGLQKLAEQVRQKYVSLAADDDVKSLLEQYNQANNKSIELAESRSFQNNVRSLKKMEDSVLTDSIQLAREAGETFRLNVVLNGKYSKELVLDSGASVMVLPMEMAKQIDAEPGPDAPSVTLVLADGSQVEAQMITLEKVRVGKFEIDSVECAVMPASLPNAAPILGMSFLRNFSFKVDSDTGLLTMSKVESSR